MRSRRPRSVSSRSKSLAPASVPHRSWPRNTDGEGLAAVHLQPAGQTRSAMIVPQALDARLESSMAFLRLGLRPVQRPISSCSTRICSATSATTSGEASPSSGGRGTRISRKGTSCRTASISREHLFAQTEGSGAQAHGGRGQHVVLHRGQGGAVVAAHVAGQGHAGGGGLGGLAQIAAGDGGGADLRDHRSDAVRGEDLGGEEVRDPRHDGAGLEQLERRGQRVHLQVARAVRLCMAFHRIWARNAVRMSEALKESPVTSAMPGI